MGGYPEKPDTRFERGGGGLGSPGPQKPRAFGSKAWSQLGLPMSDLEPFAAPKACFGTNWAFKTRFGLWRRGAQSFVNFGPNLRIELEPIGALGLPRFDLESFADSKVQGLLWSELDLLRFDLKPFGPRDPLGPLGFFRSFADD